MNTCPIFLPRDVAAERGIRTYFTFEPCKHGHISFRATKKGNCLACRREQQSEYTSSLEYKEKRREYDRQRWLNNKEYMVAKNRSYYARRSDQVNAQKRDYWSKNRDRMHEARDIWRKNNMARILHLNAMRKKQIKIATPKWADLKAIFMVYAEAERLSAETGVKHHVDHVIPLMGDLVCGLHVHNNLRPLPGVENIRKKNRFDVDTQS